MRAVIYAIPSVCLKCVALNQAAGKTSVYIGSNPDQPGIEDAGVKRSLIPCHQSIPNARFGDNISWL